MRLILDIESRSAADLKKVGAYRYAEHPSTQIVMLSWAIDGETFALWLLLWGAAIPPRLREAILNPETVFVASNSAFERIMFAIAGSRCPNLPDDVRHELRTPERWSCTANRAAAVGLPRALEKYGRALNLVHQKDKTGSQLMLEMCKPIGVNPDGSHAWLEDPESLYKEGLYCIDDGEAEREADGRLPELSPFEREVAAVTERMNDRGIRVDTELLQKLMAFVRDATIHLNARIDTLTGGAVSKVSQCKRIVDWLKDDYGIDTEDNKIGKWVLQDLIYEADLPDVVREVLILRRDGGKASVAKFAAIEGRMNEDGMIRGASIYGGAPATLRFSSYGVQLHNLTRGGTIKNILDAIPAIKGGATLAEIERDFGPPLVVASELCRPIFMAEDNCWLACGDYSQIEARVTPWLAGHEHKLQVFRDHDAGIGPDIYIVTAAEICGVPTSDITEDDPRRQIGKTTELAAGFLGGYGALLKMARIFKYDKKGRVQFEMTEDQAREAIAAWRNINEPVVRLGNDLLNGAFACMRSKPGEFHQVRPGIGFVRTDGVLAMHVPSSTSPIHYWYPKIEEKTMPWGDQGWTITYYAENALSHKWDRDNTIWRGLLVENLTQRVARDFLAHALVQLDRAGLSPRLSVHDEAICDVSKAHYPDSKDAAEAVRRVMLIKPGWGEGVPLAAKAAAHDRYVKG